jgi:hypothetical protein
MLYMLDLHREVEVLLRKRSHMTFIEKSFIHFHVEQAIQAEPNRYCKLVHPQTNNFFGARRQRKPISLSLPNYYFEILKNIC